MTKSNTDISDDASGNLAQAIALIQGTSTASKREAILNFFDSRRSEQRYFLYDDSEQCYDEIDPYEPKSDTVSNVESFTDLVLAEAERRSNATGDKMNVIFTDTGATFIANTDDRRDVYTYVRKPSIHWKILTEGLDKAMPHKQFLVWLEKLRPVIGTINDGKIVSSYNEVAAAFRALRLSQSSKMLSDPMLNEQGTKGSAFEFKLEVRGQAGGVDVQIPQLIPVSIQFARGDSRLYEFDIAIDINGGEGQVPVITPYAPAVESIKEQAIIDEMEEFDGKTAPLTKLLNLVNF